MAELIAPNLSLSYGWTPRSGGTPGDSGWGNPVSANFKKIDALLGLSVISASAITPTVTGNGTRYIVPSSGATGVFAGKDNQVAVRVAGVWEFYPPSRGWLAENQATGQILKFNGLDWVEAVKQYSVSANQYGASPSLADNTAAIQSAIDAAVSLGQQEVWFYIPGVYVTGRLVIPGGIILRCFFGAVELKLKNGANSELLISLGYESLYVTANTPGTDVFPLPLDFGFDGPILNGNRANQTVRVALVKFYGARLHMNGQIYGSKGPALRTACFGSHSQSRKTPGGMDELEIFDCDEEAWIFEGPSDQDFGHLVVSVIGDPANNGSVPQTSTSFPGEPVHGVRLQSGSMHLRSQNINGVRFGRGVYLNGRVKFGELIAAGNWGNVYATANAFGSIDSIHAQANPIGWGGVVRPSIENDSDDLQYTAVTALRVTGQDQITAPLILDNGGAQWGLVRNRQALAQGGTFFKVTASGTSIDNLDAKGAAIALHTTSTCSRINVSSTFDNCDLVWKNDATKIRGSWDFSGALAAGQVFATGIDASPLADTASLSNARIEFVQDGVWKSNNFAAAATFDATITTGQTITFTHNLWRVPTAQDIQLTTRCSGWTTEPAGTDPSINSFNSTTIKARIKLTTAATGTPTAQIVCRV